MLPPSRRLTLLCFVTLMGAFAVAPAHAESLDQALARTYETNPTLRAARAELRAVNEGVAQARSNWRPTVSVNASGGRQRLEDEIESRGGSTEREEINNTGSVSAEIRQPLYRGGRTVAGTARAQNEVRAQRKRLTATQQDVFRQVVQAYMDVWRDQRIVELNEQNVQSLREQQEVTETRFEERDVTRTDLEQARSRLARARQNLIDAEGRLDASEARYRELVGHAPGDLELPEVPKPLLPQTEAAAEARAAQENPAIQAASFQEEAAQRNVRQVEGELLPTLSLVGRATHQENPSTSTLEDQRASVQLELQIPLYQAGAVTSRVREAKQRANQRMLQIYEARRQAKRTAQAAWSNLTSTRARLDELRIQVDSAANALEGVRQEHLVGQRTVLDILDAEQELVSSKIERARARRDRVVAAYDLLAATGRLTAQTLALDVEAHDAAAAYKEVRNSWFGLGAPDLDRGGLSADELTELERRLDARGFDVGDIDGRLTAATVQAISAYQKEQGQPVTGEPSPELLETLKSSPGPSE